jgi:hypothetical protein
MSISKNGSALCKHNHLQTVGKQWQDQDEQGGPQFAYPITYILWEGNDRIRISKGVCTLQAQSLTPCEKAMAGSGSARGSTLCKHSHLHPVGRQWHDQDQQTVCTLQAQSLMSCGKAVAASARGSVLCKHCHLLAVVRQWQDEDQQ